MNRDTVGPGRLLLDAPTLPRLPEAPFKLRQALPGHPLFETERLKTLLRRMPREQVEICGVQLANRNDGSYKRGELLVGSDPVDTFERLEEKPAWILLHEMWIHDPDYNELMRTYTDEFRERIGEMQGELTNLGCWLFLSSSSIVVHFHADPDQSFLGQIRGSKTVYVYPTSVLPEEVVENLAYTGDQGAVVYDPRYEERMHPPVHLDPGESVFLPLYAPHRVINDPGLSVSWNLGFHTPFSRRRRDVHLCNVELRQLGLRPTPYDHRPRVDSMKAHLRLPILAKNKLFKGLRPKVQV